jgi:hypothetical protein
VGKRTWCIYIWLRDFGAYLVAWLIENRNRFCLISPILQKLLTAGAVSFWVTFINPVDWRVWETGVGYVSSKYFVDRKSEYRSIDFHPMGAFPFLAVLVGMIVSTDSRIVLQPEDSDLWETLYQDETATILQKQL